MEIKEYVSMRKLEIAQAIVALGRKPRLVIIQVNDSPASDAYIRGKLKDAAEVGADAILDKLAPTTEQTVLLKLIEKYNEDPSVDGLIVQLPLPKQISEDAVRLAINPKKDIDGFHPLSPCDPCTPKGIISYLKEEGFPFRGKNAVVIGRSNIVGKPMGRLLTKNDCNVTTLHSKTTREDMEFYVGHADLIVVAVGHQAFLDHSFPLKPDAYVVDVGINRGEDGKLHGDCEPGLPVKLQTPVPGGVGLLTRLALMENLLEVAQQ
jgi:methylenetetrahydrofolate dehydrogenase (NADP+)/methenyltetrahydrofolate cyclohydrolase